MSARTYSNIETAGGLLPADLLAKVAASDQSVGGLEPGDYHLGAGERLNEAISRSWVRLLGVWKSFAIAMEKAPEADLGTGLTREKWLAAVFQELGYGRLESSSVKTLDGKEYPVSHFWNHSPIHQIGFRLGLDKRTAGAVGAARFSPHSLVQQFLNASDDHLWGLVTNGLNVRLLRDNRSLTRQPYLEFDIRGIFETGSYSEFAVFWLFCHQSRLEGEKQNDCWLEKWALTAQESGVRALDELRNGLQRAIESLGQGFLAAPNSDLKEKLRSGRLSTQDYYRQLLRLMYRLIFLFVAEDRNALHPTGANDSARKVFAEHYSTRHLREIARRFRGTKHSDLIQPLWLVMNKLGEDLGCPELGLPALGSFLWSKDAVTDIGGSVIANRDLLEAIRKAAFTEQNGSRSLRSVDFANLGSEELGSVYEALLELRPDLDTEGLKFNLEIKPGNERKLTGSYYTPDSLINLLLKSALDPVLEKAAAPADPKVAEQAILDLKICDPSCGSGHFLVAAGHRIARQLAMVRSGEDEPSPEAVRHALRDVVGHCLYGVDRNDLAVELCKVSLWLEGMEPGLPLSFLEHRIICGNSLIGATPALLAKGIPEEAFEALEGDDKKVVASLRKRNRAEQAGQTLLDFGGGDTRDFGNLAEQIQSLSTIDDTSLEAIHTKAQKYQTYKASVAYKHAKVVADAWCFAFMGLKDDPNKEYITQNVWLALQGTPKVIGSTLANEIAKTSTDYQFLHWHLEFPDVFRQAYGSDLNPKMGWVGGFDVMVGNPPWERIKIQEKEWFSQHDEIIARSENAAIRKRAIAHLEVSNPQLLSEFRAALRGASSEAAFVRLSDRFPMSGKGDLNTYAVFVELFAQLSTREGRVGFVVPSGIATDKVGESLIGTFILENRLRRLDSFENEENIFPGIHHATKFCLMTLGPQVDGRDDDSAELVFFARSVADVLDNDKRFRLCAKDIAVLNPITKNIPTFRSKRDLEICLPIYTANGVLGREEDRKWKIRFRSMYHMANDSKHFRSPESLEKEGFRLKGHVFIKENNKFLPLFEGKMLWHFDHRFGTYAGQTQAQANQGKLPEASCTDHQDPNYLSMPGYWVDGDEVKSERARLGLQHYSLAFRDITSSVSSRTVVAAMVPEVALGDTAPAIICGEDLPLASLNCLLGLLNSFAFDYFARFKVGGLHLKFYILEQLPFLDPSFFEQEQPWSDGRPVIDWISEKVSELTYTANDLAEYGLELGLSTPFTWDQTRRESLRASIDAAIFMLYKMKRQEVEHVMDSFTVLRTREEAEKGEYRTKNLVLAAYDKLEMGNFG